VGEKVNDFLHIRRIAVDLRASAKGRGIAGRTKSSFQRGIWGSLGGRGKGFRFVEVYAKLKISIHPRGKLASRTPEENQNKGIGSQRKLEVRILLLTERASTSGGKLIRGP